LHLRDHLLGVVLVRELREVGLRVVELRLELPPPLQALLLGSLLLLALLLVLLHGGKRLRPIPLHARAAVEANTA